MKFRSIFIILMLCITAIASKGQVPETKVILEKVSEAVKNIQSGEYLFHSRNSTMTSGEDTSVSYRKFQYGFEANPQDALIGYKIVSNPTEKNSVHTIFDGNHLYSNSTWNGNLEVADAVKDSLMIKNRKGTAGWSPLFFYLESQLRAYLKPALASKLKMLGTESVEGKDCYKFKFEANNPSGSSTELVYYVQTDSFLPVKMTASFKKPLGKVEQVQLFEYWLTNIVLNNKIDPKRFEKSSMSYVLEKKYIEEIDNPESLLKIGSKAPAWQLKSIEGKPVNSTDFAGKIVIMDFWFKSCIPCVEQMMALQELHSKFKDDQVVIIGVNTLDDPIKDKLAAFLKNRNIKSLNVIGGKAIEKRFNVVAAPTLYVIGKDGKVLYGLEGYSTSLVKDITDLIISQSR
ncbi:redoxin domain-containing protein [Pedobacter frigiditerrae]|uniref:redoxin domain-containing protein n=1 Tax=Pedobacter frigiditerrae TaxID=2530452 RepID=UPI00292EFC05|nr:redoxin domain-containing protein [Pedobacter frigiditerrae]